MTARQHSPRALTRIDRSGRLGPADALEVDELLEGLSTAIRPCLVVDLAGAEDVHPSFVAVLRRHQRRARQQGGDLRVVTPRHDAARLTFDLVGLCDHRPAPAEMPT